MESIILLVPLFFIILVTINLPFSIKICFNSTIKNLIIVIKLFNIKISLLSIEMKNQNLFIKSNGDYKPLNLKISKKQLLFVKKLNQEIKDKITVKKIVFYSNIGTSDALNTSLINGYLENIIINFYARVLSQKPYASLRYYLNANYKNSGASLCLNAKVSFSVFDLVYSIIKCIISVKRSEKYGAIKQ